MMPPALLRMTAPLREDFEIGYHDLGDRSAPPRVALVAGIHGDELNGIFVLSRLAAFLTRVAAGAHRGQRIAQRVIVIPAVNVMGVNVRSRRWPFDGTDINRMFPGYDAGETTQRIAHAVLAVTRPAHYRIDVHSSNLDFEEMPQVRLHVPTEQERATAALFGLPAIIELGMTPVFTSTIRSAWGAYGGENVVLQAGQAGSLQPVHCERLFRALVLFLHRVGVLGGDPPASEDDEVHRFPVGHVLPLIASHAGLFISRAAVGHWVQAGDVVGHVFDGFDGELRHEVRTPVAGLLTGIRRQPLLYEGDLIARIHTRQPTPGEFDTHLAGQGQ
jgi:predicted deacylase